MTTMNLHTLREYFERANVQLARAEESLERAQLAFDRTSDAYRDAQFYILQHGTPSERARVAAALEADGVALAV